MRHDAAAAIFAAGAAAALGGPFPDCAFAPLPSLPATGPVRALAAAPAHRGGDDLIIAARLLATDFFALGEGAPQPLTSIPSGVVFPPTCHSVSIDGPRALTLRGTGAVATTRVALLDIANGASPAPIAHADITSEFILRRIALQGLHAFVLIQNAQSGIRALQTLDLAEPGFPFSLKSLNARDFALDGQTIYLLTSHNTVEARNAAEPFVLPLLGQPVSIANLGSAGLAMTVAGDRLYIRNESGRLATIDVSDPSSLVTLSAGSADAFPPSGAFFADVGDLAAHEDVVYMPGVADDETVWLVALDMSLPPHPVEIARFPLPEAGAYPIETTSRGVVVGADGLLHFAFVRCPCIGDTDGDGFIGFADVNTVLSAFNSHKGLPGYDPAADINQDGDVNFADLNLVVSVFNTEC
ncbi:MAG: hypothetical protein IBJ10_09615 [Phycisphaerales bacterium]|nr:hypothetical protein [Phycisphaerales bacterium]